MMKSTILAALIVALFVATQVQAQTKEPPIIAKIEQRSQFRYVSEVDWSTDGYYDVVYYTTDKAKVEIKIDAVTGEPRL